MGCNSCKEKNSIRKEIYESTKFHDNYIIVFFVIWTLFGFYGIYSLIKHLL